MTATKTFKATPAVHTIMGAPAKTDAKKSVMIGLEIHGYIDVPSKVKLFCDCSLEPGDPNTNICPVCTGQPGSKPMLPNREAVDAILRIALFLECKINPELMFQRKHYSWPDLPSGYQKTMSGAYSQPVGLNGQFLGVGIEEIHLEEDPARYDPATGTVDYNRSGYPLVEIVTKPEFTSSEHAREWLENLMVALAYIKAVRKDLGVKCDVNVSIAPDFIRTEVKNVNSFSSIVGAIEYEIKRQAREEKKQQTRAWEESTGTTAFMRSKETALDYMFIPDPDLPVIVVTDEMLAPIKAALPERPDQKEAKFVKAGVAQDVAKKLSANLFFANAAEAISAHKDAPPLAFIADRFINEIAGIVSDKPEVVQTLELAEVMKAFHARNITNLEFKEIIACIVSEETQVAHALLKKYTSSKQSDSSLVPLVKAAIAENTAAANDVRAGNEKAINAIVGHVIKNLKKDGKSADPAVIQKLVKENL